MPWQGCLGSVINDTLAHFFLCIFSSHGCLLSLVTPSQIDAHPPSGSSAGPDGGVNQEVNLSSHLLITFKLYHIYLSLSLVDVVTHSHSGGASGIQQASLLLASKLIKSLWGEMDNSLHPDDCVK